MWQSLSSLQIPGFIGQIDKDSIYQLLTFCDASTKSYAATVYLRIVSSKSFRVNLLYSKGRLAPLDSKINASIEGNMWSLLAAVIGVRVINFVTSELKLLITKRVPFTDSECVLYWIKATKQLPVLYKIG